MVPGDDSKPPGLTTGIRGTRHRMGGPRRIDVTAPAAPVRPVSTVARSLAPQSPAAKKRVLFVCIGNSCRSQMAEAFGRAYGTAIMEVHSAGVSPATLIAPLTKKIVGERGIAMDDHFPKGMEIVRREKFDVVVNMSGFPLSNPGGRMVEWTIQDPIGQSESLYRTVANQIEALVMRLILELRQSTNVTNS